MLACFGVAFRERATAGFVATGSRSVPGFGDQGTPRSASPRIQLRQIPDRTRFARLVKYLAARRNGDAVERTEVTFLSGAARCAGWLYRLQQAGGDAACVVMGHGMSFTRHDGLAPYAEALAGAGAAALVYDHRHVGDSGGLPRQRIRPSAQLQDRRAAIEYARGLNGIDADKIVVWGYSLGGGTAVKAAATDARIGGAIRCSLSLTVSREYCPC